MNEETPSSPAPDTPPSLDLTALAHQVEQIRRENQHLFRQLVAGEKRFRGLAKAVWRVQEAERRRLALELHDGLGQTLTALKIQLELLAGKAGADGHPHWAQKIAEAAELAGRSVDETRRLSHLLRPQVLDDLGLIPALRWFTRTLGEWTGFEVETDLPSTSERFDPDLETLIFRVAQESLNNALKHSGARGAELRLVRHPGRFELRIQDRGQGFDPKTISTGGHGLSGMRDRLSVFGARLRIESGPDRGTTIHASIPVDNPSESPEDSEEQP